jgi:hypothetical protein
MFSSRNRMILIILVLLTSAPILAKTSGSGRFGFQSKVLIAGTEINPDEYGAKFEADGSEATVTLTRYGKAPIVVKGKLVTVDKKFEWNSIVIDKDSSGREVVKALQFGGKKFKIVFE